CCATIIVGEPLSARDADTWTSITGSPRMRGTGWARACRAASQDRVRQAPVGAKCIIAGESTPDESVTPTGSDTAGAEGTEGGAAASSADAADGSAARPARSSRGGCACRADCFSGAGRAAAASSSGAITVVDVAVPEPGAGIAITV